MCCHCDCGLHHLEERCGSSHVRRFFTETEKVERLENYAEDLKKELEAVEEQIKELKS